MYYVHIHIHGNACPPSNLVFFFIKYLTIIHYLFRGGIKWEMEFVKNITCLDLRDGITMVIIRGFSLQIIYNFFTFIGHHLIPLIK